MSAGGRQRHTLKFLELQSQSMKGWYLSGKHQRGVGSPAGSHLVPRRYALISETVSNPLRQWRSASRITSVAFSSKLISLPLSRVLAGVTSCPQLLSEQVAVKMPLLMRYLIITVAGLLVYITVAGSRDVPTRKLARRARLAFSRHRLALSTSNASVLLNTTGAPHPRETR